MSEKVLIKSMVFCKVSRIYVDAYECLKCKSNKHHNDFKDSDYNQYTICMKD